MPYPSGRRDDPDDLAKKVARHLADTDPGGHRLTLRDSVLVARLMSGVIVLAATGVVVLVVFGGVNWLLGRSAPEPAAETVLDVASLFSGTDSTSTTVRVGDEVAGTGATTITFAVPLAPEKPDDSGPFPVFPSPTTTTTSAPAVSTTIGGTTSSSDATTTSLATTTSSSLTTSTTTTTAPTTTSTSPTTTSSTTTTMPPTTTTVPTTTTTVPTTTTTTTVPTTTTSPTTTTTIPTTTTT